MSANPPPRRFDLGGCVITLLNGGNLRLDGGAMFGIIPKPLWSRRAAPDDANRIPLACNCLLIELAGPGARRALIETGHGGKYDAKEQGIFSIDPQRWLDTALHEVGVETTSIADVILTHLHFDHAGGLTRSDDGRLTPTLPKARVHVQRQEFDDARANFGVMHATYREENYTPIDAANAWRLLDGDCEIIPGILARRTPGHTRGHQSILISGADRKAVFVGDVMPTAAHVGAPWNMGYDLLPLENRESKRSLLAQAAREEWLVIIDHEPTTPVVRVVADGAWFRLEPVP